MRVDHEAYREGREARRAGVSKSENPYRPGRALLSIGSAEASWNDGWDEEDALALALRKAVGDD